MPPYKICVTRRRFYVAEKLPQDELAFETVVFRLARR